MKNVLLFAAFAAFSGYAAQAQANQPITRQGSTCPLGWYSQAAYCVQSYGIGRTTQAIQKVGGSCPLGWFSQADYCVRQVKPAP